jgi:SAM-dependent methyltransferase
MLPSRLALQAPPQESGCQDANRIESVARAVGTTLAGKEVLEFGCGIGRLSHGMRSLGAKSIVAADISMPLLQAAMNHMPTVSPDSPTTIKFCHLAERSALRRLQVDAGAGAGFDVVVSLLTLHHMRPESMKAAIKDLIGLMKPGNSSWAFLHIAYAIPGYAFDNGTMGREPCIEMHQLTIPELKELFSQCGCTCKAVGDGHDWIGGGIKNALFAVCRE